MKCVAPGYTGNDMIAAIPGNVLERYVSQIPVGRLSRPGEVARVDHFVAEDDASYITSTVIPVNGGLEI
ncbi:MAG TPA: SDR family oxidoreductase [Trebonia sp.]|nr:SDR family oxidoreductase [Trebonia sp.]